MNENTKKNPGQLVIDLFGGGRALARKLRVNGVDIHYSSVSRWAKSKENGGSGGLVPAKHHQKLLVMAEQEGLKLTAEDLIHGER